jgi:hypothetical protein
LIRGVGAKRKIKAGVCKVRVPGCVGDPEFLNREVLRYVLQSGIDLGGRHATVLSKSDELGSQHCLSYHVPVSCAGQ